MATGDSAATVRQAAVSALESMGWRPGKDEGAACYWAAKGRWDKCGEIGAAAVGPLVTVLKEGDRASRDGAQGALIAIGAAAVAPMIAALKEGKLKAAPDVIEALGEIRDNRAVTPLIDVLRGKDIYARKSAVRALVKVGDAHALGGICAALQDSKVGLDVALDAAGICGSKLGNATVRDLTFKRLCDALRSGETGLRKRAAGSLGSMDDPRVVAPLIGALADANCDVRSAAAKVLIGLYQSRLLDNAQRHNILEQRHRISARHEDFTSSDCGHHTDVGIGMAFPA
jgi:HEAT repeat protein